MQKKNAYLEFISNLEAYCNKYFSDLYMTDKLLNLMSTQMYCDAREIILTGCGPSYSAAIAVKQFMVERTDIFFSAKLVDSNELAYFTQYSVTGIGEPNTPLVIIIDFNGNQPETLEILKNGQNSQTNFLLICARKGSPAESLATHTLCLDIPSDAAPFEAHAYLASVIALICLTIRTGRVRGTISSGDCLLLQKKIPEYFAALDKAAKNIMVPDSLVHHIANAKNWDFIADNMAQGPAGLIKYLAAKELGAACTLTDSEEWAHINIFLTEFSNIFTIAYAPKNSRSFDRVMETVNSVYNLRDLCAVITDTAEKEYCDGSVPLLLPSPPAECDCLFTIAGMIPGLLLIGHVLDHI